VNLRRAVAAGAGIGVAAGLAYTLERAGARRWRADDEALADAGLTMPADLVHQFVPVSDGGRIHAVERGTGPVTVLVHGVMLGVGVWAHQLRALPGRVIAVSQRGHGQSQAGTAGYGFDRLADDLHEVLEHLGVRGATLVGHSMGGMVAQVLAARPGALTGMVDRLVLVATSPGSSTLGPFTGAVLSAGSRLLAGAERRGRGPFPAGMTVWGARVSFGAAPRAADVELTRAMLDAMSPSALAALLPPLVAFDVRDRLGTVSQTTQVVVGTRDVLTPPRTSRAIVSRVGGSALTLLPGCGHMVMLERPDELCDLLG
jgi:pimeloyl-ACP methyl ester carboxylesterase